MAAYMNGSFSNKNENHGGLKLVFEMSLRALALRTLCIWNLRVRSRYSWMLSKLLDRNNSSHPLGNGKTCESVGFPYYFPFV